MRTMLGKINLPGLPGSFLTNISYHQPLDILLHLEPAINKEIRIINISLTAFISTNFCYIITPGHHK